MHNYDTKELNVILKEFNISPIESKDVIIPKVEIRDIRANENTWGIL